ncbi:MAG: hypothetical protein K0R47_295 [Brevibacillus sp.]|nr:hypothetical protein [Brevibacillus sp.]
MSQSSLNLNSFLSEAIENQRVWTIRDEEGFPAPLNPEGNRADALLVNTIQSSKNHKLCRQLQELRTLRNLFARLHAKMATWSRK